MRGKPCFAGGLSEGGLWEVCVRFVGSSGDSQRCAAFANCNESAQQ